MIKSKNKNDSFVKYFKQHYGLYLMLLIPIILYVIFHYIPMGGLLIAFQDYKLKKGIWGSEFVGMKVFKKVLGSTKFWRAFRNTVWLNFLTLMVGFPAPILLALFLNEIRS